MSAAFVDARGLKCPWPALRLAKAMRDTDIVRISADDPRSATELAALCQEQGWIISTLDGDFIVTRLPGIKP
ncbi:sulfurtransferase TusA family protein [Sphingomonas sp.]|uniref:sulfurtransferase TusA family protein n=1 Tax=Sphingomonas sp. TaxID=28214 RepID=UPI000DB0778A|nr:sulfurtransferase TusA family protein [Sphingomonas sp.]PZU09231.1 MAG: redox protein [Sphingomonas sp.]